MNSFFSAFRTFLWTFLGTLLASDLFHIPITYAQSATKAGNQIDQVGAETTDQISSMVGFILGMFPLWITALIVIAGSFVLARIVKNSVENKITEEGLEEEHKEIQIVAGRTAHAGVLIVGITVGLKIAGLDLTPIIAAGAFGIGFALQDLIMNFLAGVMILISRHYTIGDVISVNGTTGKIMEIQTRATIIKAFDGTKVIVPNAELFKNTVVSKTSNPFRKLTFIMGVGYDADLKKTMDLTLNTVKHLKDVLVKPKPSVIFYEWGDYSINFRINVWIDSKGGKLVKVKNRVMLALTEAYNNSGINIPYPIQTVQLEKAEEELLSTEQTSPTIQRPAIMTTPIAEVQLSQNSNIPLKQSPDTVLSPPIVNSNQGQAALPVSPRPTINSDAPAWLQKALTEQVQELKTPEIARTDISQPTNIFQFEPNNKPPEEMKPVLQGNA